MSKKEEIKLTKSIIDLHNLVLELEMTADDSRKNILLEIAREQLLREIEKANKKAKAS